MSYAGYNHIKYNRSPYNTKYVTAALLFADLSGAGSIEAALVGSFVFVSTLEGSGDVSARLVRDDKLSAALQGVGDLDATILRVRFNLSQLNGIGGLEANAEIFTILRYLGDVAAGDVVVFDSCENMVLHNGDYELESFMGQLLTLAPGSYRIEYEDGEETRTIEIQIEYTNTYK